MDAIAAVGVARSGQRRQSLAAIGRALDDHDLELAFRLLVIHQYCASAPWEAAEEALIEYPALFRHPSTSELRARILEDGFAPLVETQTGEAPGRIPA